MIMLSNEEIADRLLSDIEAYKENIKELIVGRLTDSTEQKIYWDAWFKSATGKDLENSDNGIIFKSDADFYCDVTVTFTDKNGKYQTATVIHDGTEDSWDSQEIDGSMYDFNTFDTRVYGDSTKGAIGCGVYLLTEKDGDCWTNNNTIDMVVNKITWVRKINQ